MAERSAESAPTGVDPPTGTPPRVDPPQRESPIALLVRHGLSPKKALGQNFLMDDGLCRRIAERATETTSGTVLEVGPGLGALTRHLCMRAERVIAVERDRELYAVLEKEFAAERAEGTLDLICNDALVEDWAALLARGPEPRTVAGNLPYLITGRLLERVVSLRAHIQSATVMIQLEVAARLLANPGTKDYGALTVFVRAAFQVERLLIAKAGAFHPRPKVDSAVVVLSARPTPISEEDQVFRALVKSAFQSRRKTLRNNVKSLLGLSAEAVNAAAASAGIDLGRRGETLSVEEFASFAQTLRSALAQA